MSDGLNGEVQGAEEEPLAETGGEEDENPSYCGCVFTQQDQQTGTQNRHPCTAPDRPPEAPELGDCDGDNHTRGQERNVQGQKANASKGW